MTSEEILKLAKEKGYNGPDSLYELQGWIHNKHSLHAEIFFSMYHKTWSVNNYFIDLKKLKRISWDCGRTFVNHIDALKEALENMLELIK